MHAQMVFLGQLTMVETAKLTERLARYVHAQAGLYRRGHDAHHGGAGHVVHVVRHGTYPAFSCSIHEGLLELDTDSSRIISTAMWKTVFEHPSSHALRARWMQIDPVNV